MKNFDTLTEAWNDLKARGYKEDFNLTPTCLECSDLQLRLYPDEFEIKEIFRFEGMSNPDDNTILFGIESSSGVKGVLVDAYGAYSEAVTPEMAKKLKLDN